MKLDLRVAMLAALLAFSLLGPLSAHAADAGNDALAQEIKALSDRVRKLESQVQQLERHYASPAPSAAINTIPSKTSVRDAWRGIKEGLTQDEVTKALGTPQRQFTLSGKLVWYYYYAGVGGGSVIFGENGHVVGSQAPP